MDRLEGLFNYLNLLCAVNGVQATNSFSVQKSIVKTCKEIEVELRITGETNESNCGTKHINVQVNEIKHHSDDELARTIARKIFDDAKRLV